MGFAYAISDQQGIHFVTFTVEQWIDVFTRKEYADIIIASIQYCQAQKGLLVYGWVLMSNHMHLIICCNEENKLSDIIRDFKKFTAKKIVATIQTNPKESRKRWLLWLFRQKTSNGEIAISFWKDGAHAEEIFSDKFFFQKLDYIHNNPVAKGYVRLAEDWLWSSAGDFYGRPGVIKLTYWND